ncbi:hypothetical protein [Streptomyces sp. NPDC089919]|uniref:hypothetical protein n=1 Tax=Streptomyces sp. NPDC089919 TaxID=3155188 RepID=UPI0034417345
MNQAVDHRGGHDVIGDGLSPPPRQIASAIGEALGILLPDVQIPIDAIRALSEDFAYANEWLNGHGCRVDIPATREIHPGTMDFRTWLERTGASQMAAFLDSADTTGQQGSAPAFMASGASESGRRA